ESYRAPQPSLASRATARQARAPSSREESEGCRANARRAKADRCRKLRFRKQSKRRTSGKIGTGKDNSQNPKIQAPACKLSHKLARLGSGSAMLTRATEGSIMPAIFDFLYREFCRARLTEMRRQLFLIQTNSPEVAAADCSVSPSDGADDPTAGDERHEAGDQ